MARTAANPWSETNKEGVQTQKVDVKIDGEVVATFQKVRFGTIEKDGKKVSAQPKTLDEAAKALGFKKVENAIRALVQGRNKMSATKARAQAKLDSLD